MPRRRGKYYLEDASYLPEMITTPRGTTYLTDELGNPAISLGALRDIGDNPKIYSNKELSNNQPTYGITNKQASRWADLVAGATAPGIGDLLMAGIGKPMNLTSPSHWWGAIRDWDKENSGVLTKQYAEQHPWQALGANLLTDGVLALGGKKLYDAGSLAYDFSKNKGETLARLLYNNIDRVDRLARSRPLRPITRRALEVAARSNATSDGYTDVINSFKELQKTKEGRKRLFDIGRYILTGRTGGKTKGYYNSLGEQYLNKDVSYYRGIRIKDGMPRMQSGDDWNDYIDAFLYGKEVDPRFGVRRVPNAEDYDGYLSYLDKNYPTKKQNVVTYETTIPSNMERAPEPVMFNTHPMEGNFRLNDDYELDAGGNILKIGHGGQASQTDIFKFKPKDYKRYDDITEEARLARRGHPEVLRNKDLLQRRAIFRKYGLQLLDDFGNPIITRIPWSRMPSPKVEFKPVSDEVATKLFNFGTDFDLDASKIIKTLKYGGKIHIKKKNRGKFNALKKRTGKTTEELTHSKNPLTRKRAIFAQNAAKWNHK